MIGLRRARNGAGARLAARCLPLMLALCAAACFNLALPSSRPKANSSGFRSFLGISFGDSPRDVRHYYPNGINETSPLGYPCYHVTGLSSDGIIYQDVIYEFDGDRGMQLVVARFAPSSAEAVLERLRRLLGEPNQHTLTGDQRMAEALWTKPGGEQIRFDRTRRLISVLGPQGGNLKKDLELRIESSAATL